MKLEKFATEVQTELEKMEEVSGYCQYLNVAIFDTNFRWLSSELSCYKDGYISLPVSYLHKVLQRTAERIGQTIIYAVEFPGIRRSGYLIYRYNGLQKTYEKITPNELSEQTGMSWFGDGCGVIADDPYETIEC